MSDTRTPVTLPIPPAEAARLRADTAPVTFVTLTLPLSLTFVLDTWDAAGYGIRYWASRAVVDADTGTYTVSVQAELADALPANAPVLGARRTATPEAAAPTLVKRQLGGAFEIHPAGLAHALGMVIRGEAGVHDGIRAACRAAVAEGDAGEIDSDAADVLVQVAAWGSVVFG